MKKNILNFILCLIPTAYALYVYNSLPDIIPIHFNGEGVADGFGSKNYVFLGAALPWFVWLTFIAIKRFDPKGKLQEMGSKFDLFLLGNVLIMSLLGIIMVHSMSQGGLKMEIKYLFMVLAALQILLGNFMPAMKPNYFMGIRTPWTLENEEVWKKTHKLAGILMVISGVVLMLLLFIIPIKWLTYCLLACTLFPVVFAYGYSYWYFQKIKKNKGKK